MVHQELSLADQFSRLKVRNPVVEFGLRGKVVATWSELLYLEVFLFAYSNIQDNFINGINQSFPAFLYFWRSNAPVCWEILQGHLEDNA